jgi:hypothetical protein
MKRYHSKTEALRILGNHLAILHDCYQRAWKQWLQVQAQHAASGIFLSPTARARMMYDYVTGFARRAFANVGGVHVKDRTRGFLTVTFGSELVVRFKKLSEDLKIFGIPTQQFLDFIGQNILELPGLPPTATLIVAGYQLDETGGKIARLVLTCRDESGLLWSHDFMIAASSNVQPMPTQSQPQALPRVRSKIRKGVKSKGA